MKSRGFVALGAAILLLAIVGVAVLRGKVAPKDRSAVLTDVAVAVETEEAVDARIVSAAKPAGKRRGDRIGLAGVEEVDDDADGLSPADQALQDQIDKALEDEKLSDLCSLNERVSVCPSADVRRSFVDALGFFGSKALAELTPFLADSDEDVRESACNEWSMAVSDIEDDGEKVSVVEMAMAVVSDEDFLEEISGEYIGIDEKLAVESLVHVISSGRSEAGVAKAKETYEFVTGDEWQGVEEAARWVAEEYEPPED